MRSFFYIWGLLVAGWIAFFFKWIICFSMCWYRFDQFGDLLSYGRLFKSLMRDSPDYHTKLTQHWLNISLGLVECLFFVAVSSLSGHWGCGVSLAIGSTHRVHLRVLRSEGSGFAGLIKPTRNIHWIPLELCDCTEPSQIKWSWHASMKCNSFNSSPEGLCCLADTLHPSKKSNSFRVDERSPSPRRDDRVVWFQELIDIMDRLNIPQDCRWSAVFDGE